MSLFHNNVPYVFGGYHLDENIRLESTSGGAFSAIVDSFCDENYVIFGAEAEGLKVFHNYITDKRELDKFRKSKYSQSKIGDSYRNAKIFLAEGKKVLFSGTPCQIAGLRMFLKNDNCDNLLTVEVVCEGVPSPLYIAKFNKFFEEKYKAGIGMIDYRFKGKSIFHNGKWDFEIMKIQLQGNGKEINIDRWFNPFWSVWLKHYMTRPSCYECKFARKERVADITLGDLWGVHLFCPELYGKNGGASAIIANTEKGKAVVIKSQEYLFGHELTIDDVIKYQSPMRNHITRNPHRNAFMKDLLSDMSYEDINEKWAKKSSIKLLFQKYLWGNRQKVWLWNLTKGKYKIK